MTIKIAMQEIDEWDNIKKNIYLKIEDYCIQFILNLKSEKL